MIKTSFLTLRKNSTGGWYFSINGAFIAVILALTFLVFLAHQR